MPCDSTFVRCLEQSDSRRRTAEGALPGVGREAAELLSARSFSFAGGVRSCGGTAAMAARPEQGLNATKLFTRKWPNGTFYVTYI